MSVEWCMLTAYNGANCYVYGFDFIHLFAACVGLFIVLPTRTIAQLPALLCIYWTGNGTMRTWLGFLPMPCVSLGMAFKYHPLYTHFHLVSLQWCHNEQDDVSNHQPIKGTDQRNIKAPRHWPLCGGIHQWPVNSLHKGPVMHKMFPFDDVIMCFGVLALMMKIIVISSKWKEPREMELMFKSYRVFF